MKLINYSRRDFIKVLGAGVASLAVPRLARTENVGKKMNFVFVLVDDLGWTDLGCYGSSFYDTPHLDRLAREGMRFTNAYAACPVCSPTRASIMAGKYPARMDTTDYFGAPQPNPKSRWQQSKSLFPAAYNTHLALEEVTLAEALQENGYKTFYAGKWHLGETDKYWPENQGFDVNQGGWRGGGPYGGKKYFSPYGNPRLEDGPEGEHLPDRLASETCKFIDQNAEKPFLAYLAFYSVHTPLMTRKDLKEKYEAKRKAMENAGDIWGKEGSRKVRQVQEHAVYAGMVSAMDQAVGKVLDKLRATGLDKNTAVIMMSDNGGLSTSEGHPTSNLPLRAGKGWLYEGGIREPMIIRWPGVTKPGSVCDEPVISTDFYPTMLEMGQLPARPKQHCDGVSLVPLLKQTGTLKRDAIYWHYPHHGNQGGTPGGAIRMGDYKLIEFYDDMRVELYNLKADIGEKHNLAGTMPGKAKAMVKMLHDWRKQVDAKMPTPNPDYKKKS
ncbi:MAG: sulfatase [Phycisphaerae bacterium]|nr:sulfatase [Phycisphaerae bacterium]